jgi:hypothetical protein
MECPIGLAYMLVILLFGIQNYNIPPGAFGSNSFGVPSEHKFLNKNSNTTAGYYRSQYSHSLFS